MKEKGGNVTLSFLQRRSQRCTRPPFSKTHGLKSRQEKEKVPTQMPFITLCNDADARVCVEIWRVMNHVFGQGLLESRLDFQ